MRPSRFLILPALAVACAGAVLTPTPAEAAKPQQQLVVTGSGARAVIALKPFRLEIQDGHGRAALSEVPNTQPLPQVEPPTTDPLPPGVDNPVTTTLYQPLSFTVGTETLKQMPVLEWAGNLLSGVRSGIQYSARDVLSSQRTATGLQLTLSTNDPTGRHLVVTVTPAAPGAMRVDVRPDPATGVALMSDSFVSDSSEEFFGFGGRHNALNQRGQVISSFVNEENFASDLRGVDVPGDLGMFPNGPTAAYYPQASFISSRPYGFFDDQDQLVRFKLDEDRQNAWNVEASAPSLTYVVAPGRAATAIKTLTAMTGRQPVPPQWGLGPMLDRLVKNLNETDADYEANLKADITNIDRYHLPLTAYRIEGWGFNGNSDNDGLKLHTYVSRKAELAMIAALHKRGIHALAYLRPWFEPGEHDALAVRKANGDVYEEDVDLGTNIDLPDFTNPATVAFWGKEVDKVLDLGFDGFMQDYGESVLFDMHFHNGATGVTEHNAYLPQYDRATRIAVTAYEKEHPGRQIFFFTRAGYSGTPGSAAYESGNFPGDETTDWNHQTGLQSLTSDMLNRAIGGAYGYGTDIGGYLDYTTPATSKELFLRWAEWAALSPVFRLHGTGIHGTHTPWSYDAQTVAIYNGLSKLHLAAAPLIMKLWREASTDGLPPTRPLWLQFPGDRSAAAQDQEWMLGPHVLVAPVVTQGATSRSIYFPSGCWRSPVTGQVHHGRSTAVVAATLGSLPYFFACGTTPFDASATHAVDPAPVIPALPRTGLSPEIPVYGGLVLALFGVVWRRRRTATGR